VCQVLEFQELYLAALPNQARYEQSFMHAEHVTHVAVAQATAFVITASTDGRVKFWKKKTEGIEFVKSFRAHMVAVSCLCVSPDGRSLVTCGVDGSAAVFDVVGFDMVFFARLVAPATSVAWFGKRQIFACGDAGGKIHLTHVESQRTDTLPVHNAYVTSIVFLPLLNAFVSCDARGMLECWCPGEEPNSFALPTTVSFKTK
jgi:peptidylprolyl isomerase domain and WD repeat-containing protein 1